MPFRQEHGLESAQRDVLRRIEENRVRCHRSRQFVRHQATSPGQWIRWGRKGWRVVIVTRATMLGLRSIRRIIRFRGMLGILGGVWGLWRVRRILLLSLPSLRNGDGTGSSEDTSATQLKLFPRPPSS